jgi:hypothetical protein
LAVFDQLGDRLELATAASPDVQDPLFDVSLSLQLDEIGDYYISVAYWSGYPNPFVPCSSHGNYGDIALHDHYDLDIRLFPPGHAPSSPFPAATTAAEAALNPARGETLLGTTLALYTSGLTELNVTNRSGMFAFSPPEGPFGGGEGLAIHEDQVFFVGRTSHYPYLYRLDAETGEVLERVATWFGSGVFGDLTVLDGVLYLVDVLDRAIYAMPTSLDGTATRLEPGVAMFGALGSFVLPDRLVVSGAGDPSQLHVLRPDDGTLDTTISLMQACPCSADLDHDGDVDGDDGAVVEECVGPLFGGTSFSCRPADLNCDGVLDDADLAILNCQEAGSGNPPNKDCCPEELPDVTVRATGLAAVGGNTLVAADWVVSELRKFVRTGVPLGAVPLETPVGKLAGSPTGSFGDGDGNARVDLIDYALFQRCSSSPNGEVMNRDCEAFDFDGDHDVDLFDFGEFFTVATGGA